MSFSYERRAHIARKLHYLDGMTAEAIAEHFERENIASVVPGTIEKFLKQEQAEETIEKVRENQADEDLRIAESLQRKHDRAREAERQATEDNAIEAVRPVDDANTSDHSIRVPDWRVLEGDERPAHAGPEDVFIEGTDGTRDIPPGGPYYELDPEGNPKYETVLVGVERDQPDEKVRSFRRQEQAEHLGTKAQILGIDEDQVNVDVGGSIDIDHSVPEEIVTAVVGASHNRLDNNADGGGVAGGEQTAEADNEP